MNRQQREDAERQRIRKAAQASVRQALAERGPIPDQVLREVVRPALVESTAVMRGNRSTRRPA